eukprot:763916-Hanusia_phi.AAC.9
MAAAVAGLPMLAFDARRTSGRGMRKTLPAPRMIARCRRYRTMPKVTSGVAMPLDSERAAPPDAAPTDAKKK